MSVAIYYLKILPDIRRVAREHGYAIGIHGSMERDFDLIAAPWVDDAKPAAELAEAVRAAVHGTIIPTGTPGGRWDKDAGKFVEALVENPQAKPHGRLAWSIQIGGGAYLDLSVMPRETGEGKVLVGFANEEELMKPHDGSHEVGRLRPW